jgi:phosphoglycolate phosphatase
LEDIFRAAFAASASPVTVLPHAREKLDWCRRRVIRSFVLTSMDEPAFRKQLAQFGLGDVFEATYAGVIDKRHRIGEILGRHGLERGLTAFVGDMVHDIETARHGGVASVAVLTGYTAPETLAEARPDFTVADLDELRKMLERGAEDGTPQAAARG